MLEHLTIRAARNETVAVVVPDGDILDGTFMLVPLGLALAVQYQRLVDGGIVDITSVAVGVLIGQVGQNVGQLLVAGLVLGGGNAA